MLLYKQFFLVYHVNYAKAHYFADIKYSHLTLQHQPHTN